MSFRAPKMPPPPPTPPPVKIPVAPTDREAQVAAEKSSRKRRRSGLAETMLSNQLGDAGGKLG